MAATCTDVTVQGQPCLRLASPGGDAVQVAWHGATVVSWVAAGRERLFLSARSRFNGRDAIRGGIPVCWPQFNARGPLPKHGFARTRPWRLDGPPRLDDAGAQATWCLPQTPDLQALWPHAADLRLTVRLTPGALRLTLGVDNRGDQPLAFTGALHTYLAVDDLAQVGVTGLGGQLEWDALTDTHGTAADRLAVNGGLDRVYAAATAPLRLHDGPHALDIAQSPEWAQTVVWTPSAAQAAQLPDLAPGEHQRLLCVEAAQVFQPVAVPPGGHWQGWQQFNTV